MNRTHEPDGHLRGVAHPLGHVSRRPTHGFNKNSREDPPVDDSFEAAELVVEWNLAPNFRTVHTKADVQASVILSPADDTLQVSRQLPHGGCPLSSLGRAQ